MITSRKRPVYRIQIVALHFQNAGAEEQWWSTVGDWRGNTDCGAQLWSCSEARGEADSPGCQKQSRSDEKGVMWRVCLEWWPMLEASDEFGKTWRLRLNDDDRAQSANSLQACPDRPIVGGDTGGRASDVQDDVAGDHASYRTPPIIDIPALQQKLHFSSSPKSQKPHIFMTELFDCRSVSNSPLGEQSGGPSAGVFVSSVQCRMWSTAYGILMRCDKKSGGERQHKKRLSDKRYLVKREHIFRSSQPLKGIF